jgi:hypothetical protein
VILGRIHGRKIVEIIFDLRSVGDFEADGGKQGFDALQRTCHRMQATARFGATGQRDIQRLFSQAGAQRSLADRLTALIKSIFNSCFGNVDCRTGRLLLWRQLAQALEKFGNLAALAEETGLGLFQRVRVGNGSERGLRFANDLIEIVHGLHYLQNCDKTPKRRLAPPFSSSFRSGAELCLGLCGQSGKSRLIEDGQIGQDLAVNFDIGLLQTIHEGAVLHAQLTSCSIDTGNPQRGTDACVDDGHGTGIDQPSSPPVWRCDIRSCDDRGNPWPEREPSCDGRALLHHV